MLKVKVGSAANEAIHLERPQITSPLSCTNSELMIAASKQQIKESTAYLRSARHGLRTAHEQRYCSSSSLKG